MSEDRFVEVPIGGMWEFKEWKILFDVVCDPSWSEPCPHCRDVKKDECGQYSFIVPFIVAAKNEGGYNSTGVCLQCIVEESKKYL